MGFKGSGLGRDTLYGRYVRSSRRYVARWLFRGHMAVGRVKPVVVFLTLASRREKRASVACAALKARGEDGDRPSAYLCETERSEHCTWQRYFG